MARAAASRIADPAGLAFSDLGRVRADVALGRYAGARQHLHDAEDGFVRLGDQVSRGTVHIVRDFLRYRTGDFEAAGGEARRALELFRTAGDLIGQALALDNLGNALTELGDYHQAVDLHPQHGARLGRAACWDSLGYAHHRLGHHAESGRWSRAARWRTG